jgi:hypothetical protein
MALTEEQRAQLREQSAALAAALGLPGAAQQRRGPYTVTVRTSRRTNEPRKTSDRPPTRFERQLLTALATDPGRIWRPKVLIETHPELIRGRTQAGLHMSAHSLWGKGLIRRRKTGERVGYQVADAGLQVLAAYDQEHGAGD